MTFWLRFNPMNSIKEFMETEATEIGLEGADFIRKELGLDLPIGIINYSVRYGTLTYEKGSISEKIARDSGLFLKKSTAIVEVVGRDLSKFVTYEVSARRDSCTGEIFEAHIWRDVNFEKLKKEWIAQGYPEILEGGGCD